MTNQSNQSRNSWTKIIYLLIIALIIFVGCLSILKFSWIDPALNIIVSGIAINIISSILMIISEFFSDPNYRIDNNDRINIAGFFSKYRFILAIALLIYFITIFLYGQNHIPKEKLYQLSGLAETRESSVFQDFVSRDDRENNVNVVSWQWADPFRKANIQAFVVNNDNSQTKNHQNYLRIIFDNQKMGFPPNIAIRSKNEKALHVSPNFQFLRFDVRIPKETKDVVPLKKIEKLSINVRIVDKHLTHWEYKNNANNYINCSMQREAMGQKVELELLILLI
jgi:hypothetical protein